MLLKKKFGRILVKYFHCIIPGLLEPLKIMASSCASSLTNSLKVGERALSGPADVHIALFSSIPLPGLFQHLYLKVFITS